MRIYAIGDIHGQLQMLRGAHALIAADREACGDRTARLVHLGDLTDRGPDSAGVIQALIDGAADGQPWVTLKGNHDRMFAGFLDRHDHQDPVLRQEMIWLDPRLGGDKTLASYGIEDARFRSIAELHREAGDRVPAAHKAFLEGLPLAYETEDLLFVHAGIRPGIPLADQTEDDLIWIRDGFLDDDSDHGRLVVHGHTALQKPAHFGNRIDLDSGAGYFRPLTAAVFEGRECWVLAPEGRRPLPPPTVFGQ